MIILLYSASINTDKQVGSKASSITIDLILSIFLIFAVLFYFALVKKKKMMELLENLQG
jgi:hypothetical protein